MNYKVIKSLVISVAIWGALFSIAPEYVYAPIVIGVVGVPAAYVLCKVIGGNNIGVTQLSLLVPITTYPIILIMQDPANLNFIYWYMTIIAFGIGYIIRLAVLFFTNKYKTYNKSLNQTGANDAPPG